MMISSIPTSELKTQIRICSEKYDPLLPEYDTRADRYKDTCEFFLLSSCEKSEKRIKYRRVGKGTDWKELKKAKNGSNPLNDIKMICSLLVPELTLDNAEEFVEKGKPLLILLYDDSDKEMVKTYENLVTKKLSIYRSTFAFLKANSETFKKSLNLAELPSLPLIVIDDFKNLFIFPNTSDLATARLKSFIKDFKTGELKGIRDSESLIVSSSKTKVLDEGSVGGEEIALGEEKQEKSDSLAEGSTGSGSVESTTDSLFTTPRDSVFAKVAPLREKYTFRDEL